MARKGLTELIIIVEKNNPITKDPSFMREMLKYQAILKNKIKLTLYPFHNNMGYMAVDFKNFRDIDLSPLNCNDPTFESCLGDAVNKCLEMVTYRHEHTCKCRTPELTFVLIIGNTQPLKSAITISNLPSNHRYLGVLNNKINTEWLPIGTTNIIQYNENDDPKIIIDYINEQLTEYRDQLPEYTVAEMTETPEIKKANGEW